MPASPKTLRSRNMTAAKRSARLIRDGAAADLATLENEGVPESSFAASVATYEKALTVLRTLDMLGEDGTPPGKGWLATVEVSRDDLDLLIHLLRQSDVAGVIERAEDSSPIGHLLAAVAPEPEQEET
jgi:hypothetical protein